MMLAKDPGGPPSLPLHERPMLLHRPERCWSAGGDSRGLECTRSISSRTLLLVVVVDAGEEHRGQDSIPQAFRTLPGKVDE